MKNRYQILVRIFKVIAFDRETIKQASEMMIFWTTNELANKTAKRTIKEMATMLIKARIVIFSQLFALFLILLLEMMKITNRNMGTIKIEISDGAHWMKWSLVQSLVKVMKKVSVS